MEWNPPFDQARNLFYNKALDYGTAWTVLRLPSLTDQIYIKAKRIRSIQDKGQQLIDDSIEGEFIGIINYCIMALIQMQREPEAADIAVPQLMALYDHALQETLDLQAKKNHDYGDAWRDMRVSSITDIILMKLHRIKQIEDNQHQTRVSEGVEGGYRDIINYASFALTLMAQRQGA